MTKQSEKRKTEDERSVISWVDFLQDHPPGGFAIVSGAMAWTSLTKTASEKSECIAKPQLHMHCPEPKCNNKMFFSSTDNPTQLSSGRIKQVFLRYICRNCGQYSKIFSVMVNREEHRNRELEDEILTVYKFGEYPPFGPPVPSRVLRLIQGDRDLFLKGRQCENQGLGIGAFTYYRRVVESQRTRLIDEIIKVAQTVNASQEIFDSLNAARKQQQFSKAIKEIEPAVPEAVLINGHNPLFLLHDALSQGVHNFSDEDCLDLAKIIRVVLVEFAEKLDHALKDEKELKDAINRLSQVHAEKKKKQTSGADEDKGMTEGNGG
jgi:hypothetical protein